MDILYMNKLSNWCNTNDWTDSGVSEEEIMEVENKYSIAFPKSYKEFLKISGKECPTVQLAQFFEYYDEDQKIAQDLLTEYNLGHLIKKRFWVIGTSGDSDSFWYFHLDEGDNPPIYRLSCMYYEDYPDESSFGKVSDSFQDWIERAIGNYESDPVNN